MSKVTVKRVDKMDSIFDGLLVRARAELGVSSFGMQVGNYPAGWDGYPEHDEASTGQEEVYVALKGSATLDAGGKVHRLEPGIMARVPAGVKRKIVPGSDGCRMLVIGGVPGKAFVPAPWTEIGAPPPGAG